MNVYVLNKTDGIGKPLGVYETFDKAVTDARKIIQLKMEYLKLEYKLAENYTAMGEYVIFVFKREYNSNQEFTDVGMGEYHIYSMPLE